MTEQLESYGLVSGRAYTSTRVRGFAPWNPIQTTLDVVGQVQAILAEYAAYLPMTNRQIFYRLVGTRGYPKTEQAYARLCEYLNRARRAGMIDFSAIRDDGTQSEGGTGYSGVEHWMRSIRYYAEGYSHNLTEGQRYHRELWVEAGGMVPQAAAVAGDYDVITYSAGGFNGLTDKHETAERLARQRKPCIVFHVGDLDPSGLAIVDALAEDVTLMARGIARRRGRDALVQFIRVAVTEDQVAEHGLPTAPQKGSDNRGEWMDETVQCEALPPDVLAATIRAAIEEYTDLDLVAAMREQGDRERARILDRFDRIADDDAEDGEDE